MIPASVQPLIDELLPLLHSFPQGEYGLALGGAHAKGNSDAKSDLDLYVFARAILPNAGRTEFARQFSANIHDIISWGIEEPFTHAGTDFYLGETKVECWLRNADMVENTVRECQNGIARRELVTWTPNGFFNYCSLSDLKAMRPLADPYRLLQGWQEAVREYPPALRETIIKRHLSEALFWPWNFHYASAVERADAIYCAGIVQQTIHNLIQVLFALNRIYFPGDKKLAEGLQHLTLQPDGLVEKIEALLYPASQPTVEILRWQRELLQELTTAVKLLAD